MINYRPGAHLVALLVVVTACSDPTAIQTTTKRETAIPRGVNPDYYSGCDSAYIGQSTNHVVWCYGGQSGPVRVAGTYSWSVYAFQGPPGTTVDVYLDDLSSGFPGTTFGYWPGLSMGSTVAIFRQVSNGCTVSAGCYTGLLYSMGFHVPGESSVVWGYHSWAPSYNNTLDMSIAVPNPAAGKGSPFHCTWTVNPVGGTPPYTISWNLHYSGTYQNLSPYTGSGSSITATMYSITPGYLYAGVTVTDANGYTLTKSAYTQVVGQYDSYDSSKCGY